MTSAQMLRTDHTKRTNLMYFFVKLNTGKVSSSKYQPLCVLILWHAKRAIWLAVRLSFPLSLPVSHFCRMFLLSWVPYCSHTELAGLPGLLLAARPHNRFFMCLGFSRLSWSGLCMEQPALVSQTTQGILGGILQRRQSEKIGWEIAWGMASSLENFGKLHQNHYMTKWRGHICKYIQLRVCIHICIACFCT